jgi:hypothetical protein
MHVLWRPDGLRKGTLAFVLSCLCLATLLCMGVVCSVALLGVCQYGTRAHGAVGAGCWPTGNAAWGLAACCYGREAGAGHSHVQSANGAELLS